MVSCLFPVTDIASSFFLFNLFFPVKHSGFHCCLDSADRTSKEQKKNQQPLDVSDYFLSTVQDPGYSSRKGAILLIFSKRQCEKHKTKLNMSIGYSSFI